MQAHPRAVIVLCHIVMALRSIICDARDGRQVSGYQCRLAWKDSPASAMVHKGNGYKRWPTRVAQHLS